MKSMVAGSALLAAGMPSWVIGAAAAADGPPLLLVLGGSECDPRFAAAVEDAAGRAGAGTVHTVALAPGDLDAAATLFRTHPGTRVIGIMHDAAYAVFHESARAAGARMLCHGRHSAGPLGSRHALLSTAALPGLAATVAHSFVGSDCSMLVTESRLGASETPVTAGGVPGFRSFDVGGAAPRCLHVSGVSTFEACALLSIDPARLQARAPMFDAAPLELAPDEGWVELIAFAMTRTIFGPPPLPAPSGTQHVFLHRGATMTPRSSAGATEACASFVIDV